MGNIQIKDIQEDNKLDETINSLLYKYIASLNYNNLIELSSKVNSTKLIIKLSEILGSLKNEQIKYLLEKKQIETTNDFLKNCLKLADYYVLIINLFTSITLTLIVHPTLEFKKIQLNTIERNINRNILAGNRLAILLNNKNIKEFQEKYHNGRITINSDICNFNQKGGDGSTTTIYETSIIPELEELYYDKYDHNTGQFFGMTSKMKKKYKTDLDSFYKTLTGTSTPANITKFQEISLSHYLDNPRSSPSASSGSSPSSSFVNYIENINSILELITKYNTTLMDVLKEIFNYNGMDGEGKREIAINSELTQEYIVKLTRTTINTIKEFYMYCEILYAKGVKIYIDIVNLQLLDTSAHQIENLKFMADHISLQQCSALDDIPSLYHSKDYS